MPAMPVLAQKVQRQTVPVVSEFVARTTASATIEVRANVEGRLIEKTFQGGTAVHKGQVLFRIDPRRYQASLLAAKAALARATAELELAKAQEALVNARSNVRQTEANLDKTTRDLDRLRPLAQQKAVPERDLDSAIAAENVARAAYESAQASLRTTAVSDKVRIQEAEAAVETAKANLAKAELDLEETVLTSPVDGIIGRSEVSVGNYVGRSQNNLLATISSVNPINVEFSLPEADYLRLVKARLAGTAVQQPVDLILGDNSVFEHKGRFSVIERAVDETTGTIMIQMEFPNPASLLRPGQFARVRATTEQRPNAILLPEKALMEIQGAKSVYIVDAQNRAALRAVTVEGSYQGMAIVTSGLNGDEQVIVEGQVKIRPGAPVAIVPAAK